MFVSLFKAHTEAKRDLKFLLIYIHQNDNKDCNTFARYDSVVPIAE